MEKQPLDEVWKDIVGYEGLYQISNYGNIQRTIIQPTKFLLGFDNIYTQQLKQFQNKGYLRVKLYKNFSYKSFYVHRLVAQHFVENPNGYKEINHIDENKLNNRFDNLEWCDRKYNCNYGTRTKRQSENTSKSVLQIDLNGIVVKEYNSITDAAMSLSKDNKLQTGHISECCKNKRKTAYGYKWKYK